MAFVRPVEATVEIEGRNPFKDELRTRGPKDQRYYETSEVKDPEYFRTNVQEPAPLIRAEVLRVKQWRQAREDPQQLPLHQH